MKVVWIVLFFFLLACSDRHNKNHANNHMNHSSFEELVDQFENKDRAFWQKPSVVLDKLGNIEGKLFADIGAGTGYFSTRLADMGAKVLALDVDQRFLDYINDHKKGSAIITRKVPFDKPSIEYNSIDGAITVNTYHHIENRPLYFREVFHALKENGILLIVDFKKEETLHGPPSNMRVSGQEVMKELAKAGFSKIIIDFTSLSEQYIISARKTKSPKANALEL